MGESAVKLIPEEWNGVWLLSDDEIVIFEVLSSDDGVIQGSFLEQDETGPVLKRSTIHIREAEGWLFMSMAHENEGTTDAPEYSWGRVKKDGNTLVVWMPDHDKFERLVESGTLPGNIQSTDVRLGPLDSADYALITSDEREVLFYWDNPIIFRRTKE